MANGSDGSIVIDTELDNSGFEKGSAKLERSIASLSDKINKIGNIPFDSARFSTQVDSARASISKLQEQMADLGSKTVSTVDYENVTESIEKAEKALFKLYDRRELMSDLGVTESSTQWRRLEMQILNAEEELKRFTTLKEQLENTGQAYVFGSDTEEYQRLSSELQKATEALDKFEQVKEKASRTSTAMAGLKKAFHGIGNAVKSAVSGLTKFVSGNRNASSAAKGLLKPLTSLKSMLFSRVKRMFISAVFSELKESLNALTKFDSALNKSMSNLKNRSKELGANLAVTFSSLIQVIEPVITRIIDTLSKATSYLNAFFAMLSGKNSVIVAKKQTESYADSLKKLNRQLMGFDEINKLNDDESSDDKFEEVSIDSLLPGSVKEYFDSILSAFESGEWEKIGELLANGLNAGIEAVDNWILDLQPKAIEWSERIARALNGLTSGIKWGSMGESMADGLNTVFGVIDTFLETYDFTELGKKVSEGIGGFVASIQWDTVARSIGAALGSVFGFIWGVIQKLTEGAGGIAKWLIEATYNIGDLSIKGLLKGLLEGIANIGTWIWENIFNPFWDGFCKAFGIASPSKVMAEGGGYIVAGLLKGITDAWHTITDFFGPAVSKIKDSLSNGWERVKEGAGSAWTKIKDNVTTPFSNTQKDLSAKSSQIESTLSDSWDGIRTKATQSWNEISSSIMTAFEGLKNRMRQVDWRSIGTNICTGIQNGLNSGWSWLTSTVQRLAQSLLNAAKSVLGIHSPSRVFRDEVGMMTGLGLAEGIDASGKTVAKSVRNLAQSTVDAFGEPELNANVAGIEMVSSLDAVANRLSGIVDSFRAITAMLNSIGGLNIPQIAVGTVAPPKTISANGIDYQTPQIADALKIANSEVVNALFEAASQIVKAINDKDTNAYLDGQQVSSVLYPIMERIRRNMGDSLVRG